MNFFPILKQHFYNDNGQKFENQFVLSLIFFMQDLAIAKVIWVTKMLIRILKKAHDMNLGREKQSLYRWLTQSNTRTSGDNKRPDDLHLVANEIRTGQSPPSLPVHKSALLPFQAWKAAYISNTSINLLYSSTSLLTPKRPQAAMAILLAKDQKPL